MDANEILDRVASRQLSGAMFHDELRRAWLFLGLEGFAMQQEYRFEDEVAGYRATCDLEIRLVDMLPRVSDSHGAPVPQTWRSGRRQAMSPGSRQTAVRDLHEAWCRWESETIVMLSSLVGETDGSELVLPHLLECISDVDAELEFARGQQLALAACEYDMSQVVECQPDFERTYSKALGKLRKRA